MRSPTTRAGTSTPCEPGRSCCVAVSCWARPSSRCFGGEYGTFDWLELRRQEREERATIERLTVEVDSLTRYAKQVQTDRRLLEQLARDNFGMIRKGEYVYRIVIDSLDGE